MLSANRVDVDLLQMGSLGYYLVVAVIGWSSEPPYSAVAFHLVLIGQHLGGPVVVGDQLEGAWGIMQAYIVCPLLPLVIGVHIALVVPCLPGGTRIMAATS